MLFFSLWYDGGGHASIQDGLAELCHEQAVREECVLSLTSHRGCSASDRRPEWWSCGRATPKSTPRYQREEILAALDFPRNPNSFREGVWFSHDLNVDALFVTLKKSEGDDSPTTMYRDYPISPTLFHWESQSTTSVLSPTGRRYLSGSSSVLLFAREEQKDEFGTSPYLFLGPVEYLSHTGDRPIALTWRLKHALPMDFFASATVAAS